MFSSLVIDTFLCGILSMQVITYWTYQHQDTIWTKLVVVYAVGMCFLITCYIWFFIQYLFVQNYGLYAPFLETRYLAWFPLLDSITSAGIQGFFAYRAFLLARRSYVLLAVIWCLIATSFGGALAIKIIFASLNSELEAAKVEKEIYIWLSAIMAADILITIFILNGLLRSKTGWAHTDKTISKLIRMTFESQLPPTLLAIACVAEFAIQPSSLLGATLQAIQSKIYGIGLMFALNSRVTFQRQHKESMDRTGGQVFGMNTRGQATQIKVDVETDTYTSPATFNDLGVGINRKTHDDDSLSEITGDKDGYTSQARLTAEPHA